MRFRAAACVVLMALVLSSVGSGSARADEPFTGTRGIELGDRVSAEFTGASGETHEFPFFAVEGTVVGASVKGRSGAQAPSVRLTRPGGAVLRKGGRSVRNFVAPYSGNFVLQVTPRATAAGYTLHTSGKPGRRRVEVLRGAAAEGTFRFYGSAGSSFQAKIRSRGRYSGPPPAVVGITAPDASDVPVFPRRKGDTGTMNAVRLPLQGEYVLAWANPGGAPGLRFVFELSPPNPPREHHILGAAAGLPPSVPESAPSALPPRAGYVGSAACGSCHGDLYLGWSQSVHNLAVRTWNRAGRTGVPFANDANGNGRDDFVDGRDLSGDAAFARYGANAPKLLFADGATLPYRVTIGAATYDVERTVGGNGLWTQQYLARIGEALYVLPVQYDERSRAYAAYEPDQWYDGADAPRFGDPAQVPPELTFEAQCSGCHSTGLVLERDTASGAFRSGFVEPSVGCEQCHGPGAEHATTGNPEFVTNPRGLIDGTPEGVASANQVCGRCHTRGEATETFPGTALRAPFGYTQSGGVQQFGDDPADFLVPSTDDGDFWGRRTDPVPSLPGDTFVAPLRYGLQGNSIDSGPHGPNRGDSASCFDCHDPHGSGGPHAIRTWVDRGVRVQTRADDNSLCLACHAGVSGPFESVSKEDAARIATQGAPGSVVAATTDHMKDVGMGVAGFTYDPAGPSGVGNCVTCHMPHTASAGAFGADSAGHAAGDHASHTFDVVWPRAGELYGVTNSCTACHPTSGSDRAAEIIAEWAQPDRDGDTTFHADTPRSFQNGIRNEHKNGGVRCAKCHTTDGFLAIDVGGETLDQAEIDAIVKKGVGHDAGITCRACHGKRPDGTFARGNNPLRYPKAELCGRCHNDATVKFGDFRDEGVKVSHPQREMLLGTAGSEVQGSGGYTDSAHSIPEFFPNGCVDCHFDLTEGRRGHDFQPAVAGCNRCHTGLTSFDRPSGGDWDGNGAVEGTQTEVDGLLAVVESALTADPQITYDGRNFNYGGATDGKMTGASDAQKRAAFNHYTVDGDGSRGIHNAIRAVQLLQRSYQEVTGNTVPGADLR